MVHGGQDGRRTPAGPSALPVVVALSVVAVPAVTALVLRPDDGLLHPGEGPLGGRGAVVVALVAVWAVGLTLFTKRFRARIGGDRAATSPAGERLRGAALPLLLAGPALLGVLALVLHRFPHDSSSSSSVPPPSVAPNPPDGGALPSPTDSDHTSWPLYIVLGVVGAVAVAAVAVVLVRRLWRRGLALPPRAARPDAADDTGDADRELLLSAVRSGRRALAFEGGDARAAVIACYAAMETALAASGVDRRASDSPADLLTRATRAGLAAGPAAPRLTALFREARYSSHPMDDTQRAAAAGALAEIAARLDEREAAG
jgi:hypothetical protein